MPSMKAAFYTLGCKVNQYETQALSEQFRAKGFQIVPPEEEADVYLVNSCTVTGTGDQKSRQAVRRFKRLHPQSIVVLTGCMPQAYPDQANTLAQADIVTGNRDSEKILDAIDEYHLTGKRIFQVAPHETGEPFHGGSISGFQGHTRAFVKIQDGCDRFCSYCIIPTSRGRVRSKPLGELEAELIRLRDSGFLEIVLVGINLSSYGKDFSRSICDAVERACTVDGILRVRLELNGDDAKKLVENGVTIVAEVSNMGCTAEAAEYFVEKRIIFAPGKAVNCGGVSCSCLEMSQNAAHIYWSEAEVDERLHQIMKDIHTQCVEYGKEPDGYINYVKGANIAGFMKVAKAMVGQGVC